MVSKTKIILAPLRGKSTLDKLIVLALLAAGGFVVYQIYINQKNITDAVNSTGEFFNNVGEGITKAVDTFTENVTSTVSTASNLAQGIPPGLADKNITKITKNVKPLTAREAKSHLEKSIIDLQAKGFRQVPSSDKVRNAVTLVKKDKKAIVQDPSTLDKLISQEPIKIKSDKLPGINKAVMRLNGNTRSRRSRRGR